MSNLRVQYSAPPLAVSDLEEVLAEANSMLAVMATRSLPVVAELAVALSVRAQGAGALKIAEAADAIRNAASSRGALRSPSQCNALPMPSPRNALRSRTRNPEPVRPSFRHDLEHNALEIGSS